STLTLNGGTLNYLGADNTASGQSFTTNLTLTAGNSTVVTTAGAGTASVTLTVAAVPRSARATVTSAPARGPTPGSARHPVSGNSVGGGTVAFGGAEGVLYTNNGTLTLGSTVSGTGGLTLAGGGALALNGSNTYTGTTALDGSAVTLGTATAISGGALTFV